VTDPPPQLKFTLPPPVKIVFKAASVQLAGVPVPTVPAAYAECGNANWKRSVIKIIMSEKYVFRRFIVDLLVSILLD
jgi:hypothetical protein